MLKSVNYKDILTTAFSLIGISTMILLYNIKSYDKINRKNKQAKKNVKKFSRTFSGHPFNVIWTNGVDRLGLFVSGDKKNVELGLQVGSLLVSIRSQTKKEVKYRVLGMESHNLRMKLQRLKNSDFPIVLTFVEQDELKKKWLESMTHRSNGRLSFKRGDYLNALNEYISAIKLHPTHKLLHSNKALCLLKLSRSEEVLIVCRKMLDIDPSFAKAHYFKAKACANLGEKTKFLQKKVVYFHHAVTELRTTIKKQICNQEAKEKLKSCQLLLEASKEAYEKQQKEQLKIFQELMFMQRKKAEEGFKKKTNPIFPKTYFPSNSSGVYGSFYLQLFEKNIDKKEMPRLISSLRIPDVKKQILQGTYRTLTNHPTNLGIEINSPVSKIFPPNTYLEIVQVASFGKIIRGKTNNGIWLTLKKDINSKCLLEKCLTKKK